MRLVNKIAKIRVQLPVICFKHSAAFLALLEPIENELDAFSFWRVFVLQLENSLNGDFLDHFRETPKQNGAKCCHEKHEDEKPGVDSDHEHIAAEESQRAVETNKDQNAAENYNEKERLAGDSQRILNVIESKTQQRPSSSDNEADPETHDEKIEGRPDCTEETDCEAESAMRRSFNLLQISCPLDGFGTKNERF